MCEPESSSTINLVEELEKWVRFVNVIVIELHNQVWGLLFHFQELAQHL